MLKESLSVNFIYIERERETDINEKYGKLKENLEQ